MNKFDIWEFISPGKKADLVSRGKTLIQVYNFTYRKGGSYAALDLAKNVDRDMVEYPYLQIVDIQTDLFK